MTVTTVSFIGFGEAARAFVGDERWTAHPGAFDIKTTLDEGDDEIRRAYGAFNVTGHESLAAVVSDVPSLVSLVTADQALTVAQSVGEMDCTGKMYFDFNSVSPDSKRKAAQSIEKAGGQYIDVAVMSPVHPRQLDTPLLVSGPAAEEACTRLQDFGFTSVRVVGEEVGRASAIKMIRSVMIKGVEALTAECFLAAHQAGVTEEICNSLGEDWRHKADYNFGRMLVHGLRRAAELREVASTLDDLGLDPVMTRGAVKWHQTLGEMGMTTPPDGLDATLDRIHSHGPEKILP